MQQNERLGIVVRMVGDSGLGYIKEEGPGGGDYSFTCDAYAKYHGEKLSDLKRFSPGGLRPGVLVIFTLKDLPSGGQAVSAIRPLDFGSQHFTLPGRSIALGTAVGG